MSQPAATDTVSASVPPHGIGTSSAPIERSAAKTTNPTTNQGTARHDRIGEPATARRGAASGVARRADLSSVAPSSTGAIARLRVSLTTVATSPAGTEYANPVATTCAVSLTDSPAHVPNDAVGQPQRPPEDRQEQHADQAEQGDRRHGVGRLPVLGARTIGARARMAELPQMAMPAAMSADSGGRTPAAGQPAPSAGRRRR